MDCKNPLVYDELNKLIFEYLDINGLEKTLDTFTQECETKNLPCPSPSESPENKAAFSHYEGTKLMKAFDDGALEGFFKLWRIFQSHIQVTSDDMAKLEVYIRVHFALWPRANNLPMEDQEKAMGELKQFFEQQKSSLGKDSAILPLYALPFVEDPYTHPIFKELFRDIWTQKLRNQLESTVQKYFELLQENICQHSRLAELIVKGEKYEEGNFGGKTDVLLGYNQDRFYQLLGNHRQIRKLLQGTRESYAKLLLVTHELVVGLEQSISGQSVGMESVLDKCVYIFPEIFTPTTDAEPEGGKPDVEYFKQLSASAKVGWVEESEVSLFFLGLSNISPEFLDYEKIKETLTSNPSATVSDKLCILQALRWLVTRTTEKCRGTAVEAFAKNDIFGLNLSQSDYRDTLFHCLVYPTPTYQKECLARFVNALSSTRTGRNYLASTTFTVDILTKSLTTFTGPTESFICQMVVATLQKLSLKKKMRLFMIEHKVINWLVSFIKKELNEQLESRANNNIEPKDDKEATTGNQGSYNPYLMEYAWALLMNLCLHEEAWTSCNQEGENLITCACTMLQVTPRKDLAPYVVSTLYSLLRSPDLYKLAKEMNLETLVEPLLKEHNELSEHLNNLVSLLYLPGSDRITSCRETNYDDEDSPDPDVFEPEIELSESWTAALEESDLTGDDLLLRKYLVEKADPVVPSCPKEEELKKTDSGNSGEIIRPMTPAAPAKTGGNSSVKPVNKKKSQGQLVNESASGSPNCTKSKPNQSPIKTPPFSGNNNNTSKPGNNAGGSKPIVAASPLEAKLETLISVAKQELKTAVNRKPNAEVAAGSIGEVAVAKQELKPAATKKSKTEVTAGAMGSVAVQTKQDIKIVTSKKSNTDVSLVSAKADIKSTVNKKSNGTAKKGARKNSKGIESENLDSPYLKPVVGGKGGARVSSTAGESEFGKKDAGGLRDGK